MILKREVSMEPKEIKFEDLKDLNYGDQIIMPSPFDESIEPYVYMSKSETSFYFVGSSGASLMISEQKTIDGFNVKLIDHTHPAWHSALALHGKEVGKMLDELQALEEAGGEGIGDILSLLEDDK
jgi:hypothetical protein